MSFNVHIVKRVTQKILFEWNLNNPNFSSIGLLQTLFHPYGKHSRSSHLVLAIKIYWRLIMQDMQECLKLNSTYVTLAGENWVNVSRKLKGCASKKKFSRAIKTGPIKNKKMSSSASTKNAARSRTNTHTRTPTHTHIHTHTHAQIHLLHQYLFHTQSHTHALTHSHMHSLFPTNTYIQKRTHPPSNSLIDTDRHKHMYTQGLRHTHMYPQDNTPEHTPRPYATQTQT